MYGPVPYWSSFPIRKLIVYVDRVLIKLSEDMLMLDYVLEDEYHSINELYLMEKKQESKLKKKFLLLCEKDLISDKFIDNSVNIYLQLSWNREAFASSQR